MTPPSLWERLRGARIVQVLLVYLGASWFVLQIAETLTGLLTLPEWVGPVAVLLLLVGLVVVLATAWVQSLPQTTAAEEAGEVPTDWQVAPSDVVASLKAGRLPHLTWGRAIMGGVMALSLLFGAAGVLVILRGGGSLIGPQEAGAELAASGIAVLPFHVTREIGETADAELVDALRVAGGTGARYAVVGSGVSVGGQVRFTAQVYDLADGSQVGDGGQVEGSPDEVLELVDELTVEVMRSLLDATEQASAAQNFRLASLLTGSVPALRHYLEGDAAFRRSRFAEARESLERAIVEDSTFALAHWRLGETIGWMDGIGDPEGRAAKEKARQYGDRLPAREATLLTIGASIASTALFDEMETLRRYVARYPDDPDGWYLMGEAALHTRTATGVTDDQLEEALYKTVELDPTFGPYYVHALEWASAKGQTERFVELMMGHQAAGAEPERRAGLQLRWDLLHGNAEERATAVAALEEMDPSEVGRLDQSLLGMIDEDLDRARPILEAVLDGPSPGDDTANLYFEQGRFAELQSRLATESTVSARAQLVSTILVQHDMGDASLEDVRVAYESLPESDAGSGLDLEFPRAFAAAALGDLETFQESKERVLTGLRSFFEQMPPGLVDVEAVMADVGAALESVRLSRGGDPEGAYQLLSEGLHSEIGAEFIGGLGDLAWRTERWREAIGIFEGLPRSTSQRSWAKFRLGQSYEAVGEPDNALAAYRTFLSRMEHADPGLTWVREAEEAVSRLGG